MSARCFRIVIQCIVSGIVVCALKAHAQAVVMDDGTSFSPDPVNIILGESVTWRDDGTGPYQIISDTGAWKTFSTPGGVLFSQLGTYAYHDGRAVNGIIVAP
jgi:plastocyanin